ncbi:Mcp1p [Lachancea thermotolerans CBS 6340]|uniref:KLTH0D10604p n=1 Tax=Lachancea thermotolerans (strain ATCC 56472 / CBS 6340 / NRRL Y-8284) TaxID=559295 RepID=C5DEX8_LACTC|nr:KLTH0D10604p [Lachancea thermotolerans CBS 6340]CAR22733.1 KLTH0D10604p [Lachancea thermotolerans CBS 6340]
MGLKEVTPEPIRNLRPVEGIEKPSGILNFLNARFVRLSLRKIQKHSIWPLMVYFPLHAVNTLVVPAISPESAPNDVLMMVRAILPGFTSALLKWSITAHVLSGLALRIWGSFSRWKTHRRRGKSIPQDQKERESQRAIGLIGGLSGYCIGVSKQLAYNPQVVTGYILTPLLWYHGRIMKEVPLEQDFGAIDIDFPKWILQNDNAFIKWFGGILPLSVLIWAASYHVVAGFCNFAKIRRMDVRKSLSTLILFLTTSGIISLWRLSKSSPVFQASSFPQILRRVF